MRTKLLLLLLLANFSIYAQTNLVPNGNFETWSSSSQPKNWYSYISGYISQSTNAQSGSSSTNMMIASGTFNFINSEFFAVTANKTYRITLFHKTVSGTFSSVDLSLYHKPGSFKEEIIKKSDVTFSSTEWRKIEFEYTPTVSENIEVDIWTTGSLNSEILVDNVSVIDIADVPAQYTLIPDVNFEKKLIALGIDSGEVDGKVSTSKINKLTSLDLSFSSIKDLTGIQDFTALTSLDLYWNQLTSLDISKNTLLTKLSCSWNSITSLDISNNLSLNEVSCGSNKIAVLDVSKNINLKTLTCDQNALTSLDISKNINLNAISCVSNKLTTLDTSNNPELTIIDCFQNKIVSLDVSKNTKLYRLSCFSNDLTTLDVSNNKTLAVLEASYNELTALDVSKNPALTKLTCTSNLGLTEINLKNGKNTLLKSSDLVLITNPALTCILVDDAAYANTNWSLSKESSSEFSETPCIAPEYTLIPDINFEKSLIQKGIDGLEDGKVLTIRISTLKTLDLSDYYTNLKIEDLTGIEDFTALEELKLPFNGNGVLKSIDISYNLALKKLDCRQNQLTTLDISKNQALTDLNFHGNYLTTIDLSKNAALTNLDCSYNRLTSLDVTKNVNLTSLSCSASNKEGDYSLQQGLLTSLDLSQNIALEFLDCSMNEKIVGFDISKNTKLTSLSVNSNNLNSIDFPENKLLKNLYCEDNNLTALDISKYPDLESLDCGHNKLTSLDLTKHPNFVRLYAQGNEIKSLNLLNNADLKYLYLTSNKLTTLDLSKNPNLIQIICDGNNLVRLNLKSGGNTKLDGKTYCSFSNNPNLFCITVDDVDYANKTWAAYKDAIASYNIECGFMLPSKNFSIETKGESCANENNGEINITASAQLTYAATINNKAYTFTNNTLKVNSLAPGTYTITITVPEESYEQDFTVTIAKAATITGKSSISSKKINVEITEGTAPYTIYVDGTEQFQTTDPNFSLNLNSGELLEVATAKACEGVFSKKIAALDILGTLSAYPNPTSGNFEIEVPTAKNEVKIELYNFAGQLVSTKTYIIENGKANLNLENQPSGIYAAKIYLETPEYVKIIKI